MNPYIPEPEESALKSKLNLLIAVSLLLFTIACGLTDETADSPSDGAGGQEAIAGEDTAGGGSSGSGEPRQAKDKFVTVKFAKGRTSGSYKDTVLGDTKHVYSFAVAADQLISAKVDSDDGKAFLKVFDPAGEQIRLGGGDTSFSETAPESGSYKVEVATSSDGSQYTVTFGASALPAKDDGDENASGGGITKTVRFAKGRSSASYRGAVIRGDVDTYVLAASGGQQMSVNISSLEDNAVFQIEGPGGYLRGAEPGTDRTSWSGSLPANGRYRVIVGGTRGNATYTISFAIR